MKTKFYLLLAAVVLSFTALTAKAGAVVSVNDAFSKEAIAKMTVEQKQVRVQEIKARVLEIRAMDKSNLTSDQKKELRIELRNLHKEARAMGSSGGGIYLSVGAIIIIILLLILILH